MLEDTIPTDKSPTIFNDGRKISAYQKLQIWELLQEEPGCPTQFLFKQLAVLEISIQVSVRQVNRYREEWGFNGKQGRPKKENAADKRCTNKEIIVYKTNSSYIGLKIFDEWLEHGEMFSEVITLLGEAIENYKVIYPTENFPCSIIGNRSSNFGLKHYFTRRCVK